MNDVDEDVLDVSIMRSYLRSMYTFVCMIQEELNLILHRKSCGSCVLEVLVL